MTPGNFNWFLHTMLFYHTKFVIEKQKNKAFQSRKDEEEEEEDGTNIDPGDL